MSKISQNPKPGIILACIILGILLAVHAFVGCRSRSPGLPNPDATIWRIGNGQFCCESPDMTGWHQGSFELDCGEVGTIHVFTTSLNTKVPCDAGGE